MVRWVTQTRLLQISSPALPLSLRSAHRPGFRTVWFRCSRGSLASITWTLRTLAHARDWLGTSSVTARRLSALATLWLTTWRIFPPSAHLTFFKVPEPGHLRTLTWACSRSQHWANKIRADCSRRSGRTRATTLQLIPLVLRQTGSASVRKREARTRTHLSKPLVPIPPAHRRLIFSGPSRI